MLWDYIDKRTANVYGIYGLLGGGKTLTAVELMLNALNDDYDVVSNVLIKTTNANYKYIADIDDVDWWSLPCGDPRGSGGDHRAVIVIDECAEFFDQYSSGSQKLRSFTSWLRHSSKRGQFVFMIVQSPDFIQKSLRTLCQKWIVCVDMASFRLPQIRLKIPFTSDFVWRRVFDKYGNLLSRGFNFASKTEIGQYYDTAQSIALEGREHSVRAKKVEKPIPIPLPIWLLMWFFLFVLYKFW